MSVMPRVGNRHRDAYGMVWKVVSIERDHLLIEITVISKSKISMARKIFDNVPDFYHDMGGPIEHESNN